MRVLCLWLPNWPAQRLRVAAGVPTTQPVAVHSTLNNRPQVLARNAAAAAKGVTIGMPPAEALCLLTGTNPLLASLDLAADRVKLERLAVACGQFGPIVSLEETTRPESLFIDVTGCGRFFGGEEHLAAAAVAFLQTEQYTARAGVADTVGVAWAAARTGHRHRCMLIPPGRGTAWLAARPIAALRLDAATVATLATLGVCTVGDLVRLPRASLPSRFGVTLLQRLDQAVGTLPEPLVPIRPPEPPQVQWSSETPLTSRGAVEAVVTHLLGRLLGKLAPWETVALLVGRFNGVQRWDVRPASPSTAAARLLSLVRLTLERRPPPREVSQVLLTAELVRRPAPGRTSLFAADRTAAENQRAVLRLTERLCGRLGTETVLRPQMTGDPVPERTLVLQTQLTPHQLVKSRDAATETPDATPSLLAVAARPILLLPTPEQIRVWSLIPDGPPFRLCRRGRMLALPRTFGPERIEAGWAADACVSQEVRRDYWRAEAETGERLWLFRCRRTGRWFLHGLFG